MCGIDRAVGICFGWAREAEVFTNLFTAARLILQGQGIANPMAMILSAAMMLRHSFGDEDNAQRIERTVADVLADGVLGHDLGGSASTSEIGDAVVAKLSGG